MSTKLKVALLRGINVGGKNRLPMADLRATCLALGWGEVRTHIQSGNVVFQSTAGAASAEKALEEALARAHGLDVPVLVRTASWWQSTLAACPFPDECIAEPNLVLLGVAKKKPRASVAAELEAKGDRGERVRVVKDALWIHYAGGSARSKISTALLDRLVGGTVTGRNVRTVEKIAAMF